MLIDDFDRCHLLVVGDVMLDHFIAGKVERVSPEAPALVLRIESDSTMLGGAGNVAANIVNLGGSAALVGVIGNDAAGGQASRLVERHGSRLVDGLVRAEGFPTTEKTRYIAGDRHLLRADREGHGLETEIEERVIQAVLRHMASCDAILISDYAKGVVSRPLLDLVVKEGDRRGLAVIVDPKRRDFTLYEGADVLTPNVKELEFASGMPCEDLESCERAAASVIRATGASILLTRSESGVAVYEPNSEPWSEHARAPVVRDVSGAGDTVLAVCALGLAAGASLVEAAQFANAAAAVAVGRSGTAPVTRDELNFALMQSPDTTTLAGKLVPLSSAASICAMWRGQGLQIGFTNGCFDLLHPGHIELLARARDACDRLVVALNTDASIKRLKGPNRPIQAELSRAAVVGAVRSVDLVILFDEDTPVALIDRLSPDVLIKGADYTLETVVGADLVTSRGGRVELVQIVEGASSTGLIERSRDLAAKPAA